MTLELLIIALVALAGLALARNEIWKTYRRREIDPLRSKLEAEEAVLLKAQADKSEALACADLFDRNLRAEIAEQHDLKSAGYAKLKPIQERKSEVHRDLRRTKDKLNDWHRRSRGGIFGNGRRKIKNDSFWGWVGLEQTMAQKEALERDIGRISDRLSRLSDEMDDIYGSEIGPRKEALDELYGLKRQLEGYRAAGHDKAHFLREAAAADDKISTHQAAADGLKSVIEAKTVAYRLRSAKPKPRSSGPISKAMDERIR